MLDLTFATVVFCGWIFSVCAHEFGHALLAYWGGDVSVKDKGYLTFNPLKYTDVQLSLVLPLVFLLLGGIPLPGAAVYINQSQLRSRGWQSAVAAAGPGATLGVALGLGWLLHQLPGGETFLQGGVVDALGQGQGDAIGFRDSWFLYGLSFLVMLQMAALVLNLLPIPPLDGYGIVEPWLPRSWQNSLGQFRRYGFLVILGAFWLVPAFSQLFWSVVVTLTALVLQTSMNATLGTFITAYGVFQGGAKVLLVGVLVVAVIINQIHQRRQPCPPAPVASRPPRRSAATPTALKTQLRQVDQRLDQYLGGRSPDLDSDRDPDLTPDSSSTPTLGDLWYQKGLILVQQERWGEAQVVLAQSLEQDPQQPKVWYEQGRVLVRQGDRPAALEAFQRCLILDPQLASGWYEVGQVQLQLGQAAAALISFQTLATLLPQFAPAPHYQALAHGQLLQWSAALMACDRALSLKPQWADPWLYRGVALMELRDYDRALSALDRALDLDPDRLDIYYQKACCHSQLGQITPALDFLHIALAADATTDDRPRQRQALQDPHLAPLASHPRFLALMSPS